MIWIFLFILIGSGWSLYKSNGDKKAAIALAKEEQRKKELALMREAASNIEALQAIIEKHKVEKHAIKLQNANLKAAMEDAHRMQQEIIYNKRVACLFGAGNILGGTQAGWGISVHIGKTIA